MSLPVTLLDPQSDATARGPLEPWHLALRQAGSRAEVMAVVNDFIEQCDEDGLGELPDGCRPWKPITDVVEVHFLKHLLSVHDLEQGHNWPLLRSMCSLFRAASARVAQLGPSLED
jgi:hypothetical protein